MTDLLNSVNVKATSGVTFGTGSTLVTLASSVSAGRTYTISDAGSSSANFMMDIGGVMQITNTPSTVGYVLTGVTSTTANWQAASVAESTSELLTLSSSSGTQANLTLTKSYTEVSVTSGVTPLGYGYWASTVAGVSSSSNSGNSIAVDPNSNNVYVGGQFTSATLTPYNSNGTAFGTTLSNSGSGSCGFIVKYNDRGFVLWAASINNTTLTTTVASICVSSSTGRIYVAGLTQASNPVLKNSDGTTFFTVGGGSTGFVACYNSAGFGIWAAGLPVATGIAVNSNTETIYVSAEGGTVYSANGVSFGTGAGNSFCAYNSVGSGLWVAHATTGTNAVIPYSVAVNNNSGNIICVGLYYVGSSTLTIYNAGGGASGLTLSHTAGTAGFIVAYNSLGIALWAAKFDGSSSSLVLAGISVGINSATGNIYVTAYGNASPVVVYSSGNTSFNTVASKGATPFTVVACYNSAGIGQWDTQIGYTSGSASGNSTCINSANGNVYIGGAFSGTAGVYSTGASSPFATVTSGTNFFAAYTSAGTAFWLTSAGCGSGGICVSPTTGWVLTTGGVSSTATIYNSDTTTFGTLTAIGTTDCAVICYDNLVTNYLLPAGTVDPTTKILLFQNLATTLGVIVVVPAGTNNMYSVNGKVVYRLYFTTTGNKVALTWTNGFWTIQGNLKVPVVTA